MDLMDYRRKIIANSPHLMSAEGAVVSFADGADLPLKSLNVDIEPVQSGTGDPSPDNVRPISGWNAVKVTRDGKNLLDDVTPTVVDAYVSNQNGRPILRSSGENRTVIVQMKPNTTYTYTWNQSAISGAPADDSDVILFDEYPVAGVTLGYSTGGTMRNANNKRTFNSADYKYAAIKIANIYRSNYAQTLSASMLELGSTATAYEPYNGTSLNIQLGRTVYGGTLNLLTGVLTVDAELEVFNNVGTNIISSNINYLNLNSSVNTVGDYTRITFDALSAVDQSVYNRASNTYKYKMCNLAPHKFSYNDASVHWYRNTALYLFLPTSLCGSTAQNALNYLVGIKDTTPLSLWIPLATPYEIQLTPQQVRSLYGNNTIFADTGNVVLEYWAHQ